MTGYIIIIVTVYSRAIRHLRKQKRRLKERLVRRSEEAGGAMGDSQEHLFQLTAIKSKAQLQHVDEGGRCS